MLDQDSPRQKSTMSDVNDMWESLSRETGDVLQDSKDPSVFSEHELLDIMYDACQTSSPGAVLASTIMQYLQSMTAQSPEQDRLASLQQLLDPDCQDPHVSRDTFHATMSKWIAQCSQDSTDMDGTHISWPDSSKVPVNGLDFSCTQIEAASSENHKCSCDGDYLLSTVAELKHAQRMLSEQNSSLLRTVAQCEDVNLQLTLEITDLKAKLDSAHQATARTRSLTEELDETRRAFRDAQERASHCQTSCTKLNNEVACLKVHIRRLEDKNEKLLFERTCAEDSIDKLKKGNTELKAELEETLVVLMLRDRDIKKQGILLDKMKSSHVENHNMIKGLQSELTRLHEHSCQVLLRYDRHCIGAQSFYSRDPANHRNLQSEMQDMQEQHYRSLDDTSLLSHHAHSDDIQSVIHRIRSAEISHLLHNKHPERDSAPVETQERPLPHRLQQQTSIKQQLVNVLQELELHKCVWEEKGEKVEEHRRACEKEQGQSQIASQTHIQEAKKVAVVNWWKALGAKGANARTKEAQLAQELSETHAKLQQTEKTINDMREQVFHLQASLRSAQECIGEPKNKHRVLHINKGTITEREDSVRPVERVVKEHRDAAVATESTGGAEQEQTQLQVSTDGLLATLRRMEAMVSNALEAAELVRESEHRVSQVRVRMESITHKVEEALGRAADTDKQLNLLEDRIMGKAPTQSPGPSLPDDPGPETAGLMAESDVESEERHRIESSPQSAVIPEVIKSTQLPMNGMPVALRKYSYQRCRGCGVHCEKQMN